MLKRFRWALLLASLAVGTSHGLAAEHNALTAEERAAGWILLFDGETTFGWKESDKLEVKNGAFILKKGKTEVLSSNAPFAETGRYTITYELSYDGIRWSNLSYELRRPFSISRADLAQYMLSSIENSQTYKAKVEIAY